MACDERCFHKDSLFLIKFVCIQYPCLVEMKRIPYNQLQNIKQNDVKLMFK